MNDENKDNHRDFGNDHHRNNRNGKQDLSANNDRL